MSISDREWAGRGVGDLYGRLRYLTDKGLYGDYILAHYTHEEIAMAEDFLCPERDELFTHSGLCLLYTSTTKSCFSRHRTLPITPAHSLWQ